MKIFATKEFSRYARRELLGKRQLCEAARRAARGIVDADLGGGLIKQRVGRAGQGRSGGFRFLMAFRASHRTVFLYGFAKSERGNIDPDELHFWRTVAAAIVEMSTAKIEKMLNEGELHEVNCDQEKD